MTAPTVLEMIRDSQEEAAVRGFDPPSPEERRRRKEWAAWYLSEHGDERDKEEARAYLLDEVLPMRWGER